MGKVEVRVSDERKAEWRAVALERGVSVSEFVRAAVEQELGRGSVAAGPPVVEAERDAWVVPSADPATWRPASEDAKVVKPEVSYLRRLMEDSSEAVPFAPAAPPVKAKFVACGLRNPWVPAEKCLEPSGHPGPHKYR